VGNKLTLRWPFEGRMFYVDSVHRVGDSVVVVNGDRRAGSITGLIDMALAIAWLVRQSGKRSVFFGCTPHQPGSWWIYRRQIEPLHTRGYVDLVPLGDRGLVARRSMDPCLFFLPAEAAAQGDSSPWQRIYTSPVGNLLMLERRLVKDRLVLSCQHGLAELDLSQLPRVRETGLCPLEQGFAVVGRISDGAFAVTRGNPLDWGYDRLQPATLMGSRGCSFIKLRRLLDRLAESSNPFAGG
jgi:hypothetical protein